MATTIAPQANRTRTRVTTAPPKGEEDFLSSLGFIILASSLGLGLFALLVILAHKTFYKRKMKAKMAQMDLKSKEVLKKQIRALLIRFERHRLKEGEDGQENIDQDKAQHRNSQREDKQNAPLSEAETEKLNELMGTLPDNLKAMQIFRADMKRRHGVYRKQLQNIYRANAPEKVQYVDTILENVQGDEEKFIAQIVKKYYPNGGAAKTLSMRMSSRATRNDDGGHFDAYGDEAVHASAEDGKLTARSTRRHHTSTAGIGDDGCIVIDVGGVTMASGLAGGDGEGNAGLGNADDDGSAETNTNNNNDNNNDDIQRNGSAAKIEMAEIGSTARRKARPARKRKKNGKGPGNLSAALNARGTPEASCIHPTLSVPHHGDNIDKQDDTDNLGISSGSDSEFDPDPDEDGTSSSSSSSV